MSLLDGIFEFHSRRIRPFCRFDQATLRTMRITAGDIDRSVPFCLALHDRRSFNVIPPGDHSPDYRALIFGSAGSAAVRSTG